MHRIEVRFFENWKFRRMGADEEGDEMTFNNGNEMRKVSQIN
jgi:hypothetical protein